jgi:hypothetical protein
MVLKRVLVPDALDKKIRRLAQKRGISQSALILEAVEAWLNASRQADRLTPFIGVIKGGPPNLSESIDDVVYRWRVGVRGARAC